MAAHIIGSIAGESVDVVPIRRALLSVSDKTGLVELATALSSRGVELLSTGGTAAAIRKAGLAVKDVSEYTGFPEMLGGRVKTLHPKVHGGIMYVRGNVEHEASILAEGIQGIDLVVLNLYAFEATVAKGADFGTCVENVDIGGPSMLRSSAKNHAYVTIATDPAQYPELIASLEGGTPYALRRRFAAAAFALSARYDAAIATWFADQLLPEDANAPPAVPDLSTRCYTKRVALKYGCNPHQLPAALGSLGGKELPFTIRSGAPGYINMLDALNAYQLVAELRTSLALPAAASFKHVSPAGAAVGVALSEAERALYEIPRDLELTPLATAYVRARQADPLCSFGDFVALSDRVDVATARVLQKEVSDGCIAPGYDAEALEILAKKKGGKFVAIEMDPAYAAPDLEYREVFGVAFVQRRNDRAVTLADVATDVCGQQATTTRIIPVDKQRDLVLASIAAKYTQSNSVVYALNGMLVGVGAGQQSRVDCVQLAGRKLSTWWLRQSAEVLALPFKAGLKRQDRVNARVRYIEGGDFTPDEKPRFDALFETPPQPLTDAAKKAHMATLTGVCLASDAFFPFRDNIDVCARFGVKFIAQAGGSVQDDKVVEAAREHGIQMAFTNIRLFHH